jgi:hypothetical protein
MGQSEHRDNSPDAGNATSPPSPFRPFVGDGQPPKNSAKSWIIGCSVTAGVVIFLCTLMSFALFLAVYHPIERETDGKAAIQNFCRAMQVQDYVLAYNTLSRAARGRIGTVDQFVNQLATLDRSQGVVTSCVIDFDTLRAAAAHSDGKRMVVYIGVLRGNTTSNAPNWSDESVMLTLVFENNAWKVDDADPAHILF